MHLLIEKTLREASRYFHDFFIHEYTKKTYLHKIDPVIKLVCTTILVLMSILTFKLIKIIIVLLSIYILAFNVGIGMLILLKRSWLFAFFAMVIVMPVSILEKDYHYAIIFPLRVLSSISALQLLILTTKFNEMLSALKRLRAPEVILEIVWLTYRYTVVMFRDLMNILLAREARRLRKSGHVEVFRKGGRALGLFFLRSVEKGEMIELAMKSRGKSFDYKSTYLTSLPYLAFIFGVVIVWVIA